MRLVFLCSGLEPGCDGIGDFARMLAVHCAAQGHEVRVASVRDSFCEIVINTAEEFRAPDIFSNPAQARELAAWLREFNPDWASVQFTPFGFHPRGLGGKRATFLREIMPATTRRHIMLHEIWLQPGRDGPLRHRALGWAQRRSVDAWTGPGWRPEIVQTQARLHQARLRSRGVAAELLPLCPSFERAKVSQAEARLTVAAWLKAKGQNAELNACWLGHFGAFHQPAEEFIKFAREVVNQLQPTGRRAAFLALGRAVSVATVFADAARALPEADFLVLGELSVENVSVTMQACDCAFTTTPWDIIEKSGTVAAWRALDIPVLVIRLGATDAKILPSWPDPGLILAAEPGFRLPNFDELIPAPGFLQPNYTAKIFLAALDSAPRP
jgi:hypothetical protein